MKSYQVLFLLAAVAFSAGSCTKELSKESPAHPSSNGNFYATIDGQPWQADSLQQVTVEDGVITITGISGTQDALSMVLPALQTGVYAVNGQSPGFAVFTNIEDTAGNMYLSNATGDASKAGGTISLTAIDTVNKTVSGTFQFKLYQESNATTKTVTGGVFNDLSYSGGVPVTPPPPDSPSTGGSVDTVLASIDGTAWTATQVSAGADSNRLIILGASDDDAKISLLMPQAVEVGTHQLDPTGGNYVAFYSPDALNFFLAEGNGSITILENDTVNRRIRGNFSFTGYSQADGSPMSISSGYFSVNY